MTSSSVERSAISLVQHVLLILDQVSEADQGPWIKSSLSGSRGGRQREREEVGGLLPGSYNHLSIGMRPL